MKAKEKITKIHQLHNTAEELFLGMEKEDVLFDEIFRIYNLTSMLSAQVTIRTDEEVSLEGQVSSNKEKKKQIKLPFNLEWNLINIVGISIMVFAILAFVMFVYAKVFSNAVKGIVLLALPIVIMAAVEKILRGKNRNVSIIVSIIGSLLICFGVIMNFAVLKNISNIGAIAIILIITLFGIYFSYKKNLTSVRILSIIGSFIIAMPILFQEYKLIGSGALFSEAMSSLSVCVILIIIALANALMPMKNNKKFKLTFPTYSAIIMLVFNLLFSWYMNNRVYPILALSYLAISNILFVKAEEKENPIQNFVMIMNNILLVTLMFLHMSIGEEILLSASILGFMMICTYATRKNKYTSLYYANSMFMFALLILFIQGSTAFKNTLLIVILSIVLVFIGIITDAVKSDSVKKIVKYICVIYAGFFFVFVTNAHFVMGSIMYAASFVIIQQMLIDNTKAKYYNFEMKFMRYFILCAISYMIFVSVGIYGAERFIETGSNFYNELPYLAVAVVVQLNYMISKSVNELTVNEKDDLKFILVITVINMLLGYGGPITLVITSLFALYDLYMLLDSKVVKYYTIDKNLLLQMLIIFFIIRCDEFKGFPIRSVGLCVWVGIIAIIAFLLGYVKDSKGIKKFSFGTAIIVGGKTLLLTVTNLGVSREIIFLSFITIGIIIIASIDNVQSSIEGVKNLSNSVVNMVSGKESEDAEKEAAISSN